MKRKLMLQLTISQGAHDVRLMDYIDPAIVAFDKSHRVGIRIVEVPNPSPSYTNFPDFLSGFQSLYSDALIYLLEDSRPVPQHEMLPECTFSHLKQLADFLKETN